MLFKLFNFFFELLLRLFVSVVKTKWTICWWGRPWFPSIFTVYQTLILILIPNLYNTGKEDHWKTVWGGYHSVSWYTTKYPELAHNTTDFRKINVINFHSGVWIHIIFAGASHSWKLKNLSHSWKLTVNFLKWAVPCILILKVFSPCNLGVLIRQHDNFKISFHYMRLKELDIVCSFSQYGWKEMLLLGPCRMIDEILNFHILLCC